MSGVQIAKIIDTKVKNETTNGETKLELSRQGPSKKQHQNSNRATRTP